MGLLIFSINGRMHKGQEFSCKMLCFQYTQESSQSLVLHGQCQILFYKIFGCHLYINLWPWSKTQKHVLSSPLIAKVNCTSGSFRMHQRQPESMKSNLTEHSQRRGQKGEEDRRGLISISWMVVKGEKEDNQNLKAASLDQLEITTGMIGRREQIDEI